MAGWIKLHRSIQEHWIWDNPVYLKWWLDLLLMANHKPNEVLVNGKIERIDIGERLTSEVKLSERWSVDRKTVRKFLSLLEKEGMISLEKSRKKGTTYKVLKYKDYQQYSDSDRDIKLDNGMDNAMDNGMDINKNEKNEKNVVVDKPNIVQAYEYVFGMSNSFIIESLNHWCNDLSEELVIEALKQSAAANANSFKYTEAIMKNWEKSNVKTLSDVEALKKKRTVNKQANQYKKPTRKESVPDWFDKPIKETPVSAEEQAELNKMIAKFGGN